VSCSESEDPGKYENWRERNEAFIDSLRDVFDLKTDSELKALVYPRDKKYNIYYKVLKEAPVSQPPFYTSTVYYYYREMLIDEAVFGASAIPRYYTKLFKNLEVFKENMGDDDDLEFHSPRKFVVSLFESKQDEMNAYTEILQHMRVGERWEVYIPWQLAYGSTGTTLALGYSAVVSDITLQKVDY